MHAEGLRGSPAALVQVPALAAAQSALVAHSESADYFSENLPMRTGDTIPNRTPEGDRLHCEVCGRTLRLEVSLLHGIHRGEVC